MNRSLHRSILCLVLVAALQLIYTGCSPAPRFTSKRYSSLDGHAPKPEHFEIGPLHGVASYYAHEFNGRKTANGERFDMNDLTAAHRTLPFGTRLKVTNTLNGKSVVVRVNDRGPFKKNRIIDVSYKAAQIIGLIGPGSAEVKLEIVGQ